MPSRIATIETIVIKDLPVRYFEKDEAIFFCMTDIARSADTSTDVVMQSYLKNANIIEFLSKWEEMHNTGFNPHRLVGIKTAGARKSERHSHRNGFHPGRAPFHSD